MKQKRILAFLLSVAMTISLLPTFTLTALADETQTTTTEKNIMLGTSALKGGQQSNVWFGNYQQSSLGNTEPTTGTEGVDWIESTTAVNNGQGKYYSKDPIKWRVLDTDNDYNRDAVEGETDTTRSLFLLSDQNLDVFQYHLTRTDITWYRSTMRSWLNGYDGGENDKYENYSTDNFIDSAFSSSEKNAIVTTKVINSTYDGTQGTNPNPSFAGANKGYDTEDKIFLLSIAEAMNTAYGFNADKNADEKRVSTNTAYVVGGGKLGSDKTNSYNYWWLRSPGGRYDYSVCVCDDGDVFCSGLFVDRNYIPVRPAFNLNTESILFTSSKGEKSIDVGNIKTNESYTISGDEKYEYKLTMLDESRTFEVTEKMARDYKGETITFNYDNAESGSNEYISAMIVDNSDDVLYYGQVAKVESESGTVTITLPSDIADGKYTLKLFNEQINGDYKTDFSSAFSDIDLTIGLEGGGTETDPYLIHTLSDLEYFRDKVNTQEITSHSAMLTADITIDNSVVWTPIALADHCKSTFDGNRHTITFANTKEGSAFGLFDSYNYSTIKNLYLAGSITCNSTSNVGALVNRAYSTTIQNVISTCTVNNSGTKPTGGLTGYFGGGSATIKNSAVYADVTGGGYAGGFIGSIWNGNQPCSIYNSAYMGSVSGANNTNASGALVGYNGNQSGNTSSFTDVYYYEKNGLGYLGATNGGTITATRVESKTAEQFRSGEVAYLLNNGVTDKTQVWYQTCKTDSYPKFKGDTVYRGYVCGNSNPIYANSMDGLVINPTSEHIYDETGFCKNCKTAKPADLDTTENVYKIYSLGELKWLADKVNSGETSINGKLMNDIDATSLSYLGIGKDASHSFAGTFDGNNKTLKIALVSTEQYTAPFPHIGGATIKNLTVSGTVKTTHKFAAGIVGRVESGNAKLENCLSLVEVDSTNYSGDGTHGGLLAVAGEGSTTSINNCGFAGSIIGENTTSCGGIVGWAGSTVKISNSFVAAKFELKNNSGDTFARNQKYVTVTNCYYLNALSDSMYSGATQKSDDQFASGEVAYLLQGTQETQIWGQKIGTDMLPTFSEAKVYEDTYNSEKIYRNEINENKIFSLGADKKSATVLLNKAGTYTIVFVDYEDKRLANLKTFEVTVDKAQAVRVVSDKDFTLGTNDKIMLWDNLKNLTPMCEAYEIK